MNPEQGLLMNPDPDPGFWWPNMCVCKSIREQRWKCKNSDESHLNNFWQNISSLRIRNRNMSADPTTGSRISYLNLLWEIHAKSIQEWPPVNKAHHKQWRQDKHTKEETGFLPGDPWWPPRSCILLHPPGSQWYPGPAPPTHSSGSGLVTCSREALSFHIKR